MLEQVLKYPVNHGALVNGHLNEWVEREALRRVAIEIAEGIDAGKSLLAGPYLKRLRELTKVTDVFEERSTEYATAPANYWKGLEVKRVPIGIANVDSRLGGGLGGGELGVIVAPAKGGKTNTLVHLGASAARAGKKVLHISLEIHKDRVLQRYDQCIGGFTKHEVQDPRRVKTSREIIRKAGGNIVIRDCSHEKFTAQRLDNLLSRLEVAPDMIIVDYVGLMASDRNIEGRRFEISDACKELRRIASDRGIPVWTASQSNRSSFTEEVGPQHIAEDISIVQTCDLAIFLILTPILIEAGKMVWRVFSRNDGDWKETLYCNFDRLSLTQGKVDNG